MQEVPPTITICSTKYDGSLHWRYEAQLLESHDWGWISFVPEGEPVETHKGTWLNLHPLLRWHWRERWWDAVLVFKDDGTWLEWYCNIITPPRWEQNELRFQDLDLDVVWHHARGLQIIDADEFEQHAVQMAYPSSLIQKAWRTAQEVRRTIERGEWRFGEATEALTLVNELRRWPQLAPRLNQQTPTKQ